MTRTAGSGRRRRPARSLFPSSPPPLPLLLFFLSLCVVLLSPLAHCATLTLSGVPSTVYAGQAHIELWLTPSAAIPPGDPLTVAMDTAQSGDAGSDSLSFPGGWPAGQARSFWYIPPASSFSETLRFTLGGSNSAALALFTKPANRAISVVSYPSGRWGATATSCNCASGGVCDSGYWGTGVCQCKVGFTGTRCDACLPDYYGSTCQPCQCGPYSTCRDGISGWGSCTCQPNYSNTRCTRLASGELVPLDVEATGLQDKNLLVVFLASINSPAWSTTLITLPARGALFLTSDGVQPTTQITATGTSINRNQAQRLLYVPPAGAGAAPGELFESFRFRVSSTQQNNQNNYATVRLYVKHINEAPLVNVHASLTDGTPAGARSGSMLAIQNEPLSLLLPAPLSAPALRPADPDGSATTDLVLDVQAGSGSLGFAFPRTINPALLAAITPKPASLIAPYSTQSLRMVGPPALLANLVRWMQYRPASATFVGADTIALTVNDRGQIGVSATTGATDATGLTDTASLVIFVQRVNAPISIVIPPAVALALAAARENEAVELSAALADVDSADNDGVVLRMQVLHGTLSFSNPLASGSGLSAPRYGTGTGTSDVVIAVNSTLATLNVLLASFTYTPALYYSGPESLSIYTTDMDTALGGPSSAAVTLPFSVAFVDFPPVAHAAIVDIREDSGVRFNLQGEAIDYATAVSFRVTALPDPRCMLLFQWDSVANKRGALLSPPLPVAGVNLTDVGGSIYAKMVPSSRFVFESLGGCPLEFVVAKPSGVLSAPAAVRFNLTHLRNHPPLCEGSTESVATELDSTIVLRVSDPDGDGVTLWIAALPVWGTLFQYDAAADAAGAEIDATGVQVEDAQGRVIYRSLSAASFPTSGLHPDSFGFSAVDAFGSFGDHSTATVTVVVTVLPADGSPLVCPNVTLVLNAGVGVSALLGLQSDALLSQGTGLTSVRLETVPSVGSLYQVEVVEDGELAAGAAVGVGFTMRTVVGIELDAPLQLRALSLFFQPPSLASGDPLSSFDYSCTDSMQRASDPTAHGVVSLVVAQVPLSPTVPEEMIFSSVPHPAGLSSIQLLANVSDVDSDPGDLSIRILRLPSMGSLRRADGVVISAVPTTVQTHLLSYVPRTTGPSPPVPPFFDTFVWAGFDGRLASSLCATHLVVGAASMPPSIVPTSASQTAISTFEGGAAMRVQLSFTVTEPKLLGKRVKVLIGSLPRYGQVATLANEPITFPDATIQHSLALTLQLWYSPPLVRGPGVRTDNFTLYVVDEMGLRSSPPLLVPIGLQRLNQPPRATSSAFIRAQDAPALMRFNLTTFGNLQDLTVELLSPLPDLAREGALFPCPPLSGAWSQPINETAIPLTAGSRLIAGCDGDPSSVGVVFVPVALFSTLSSAIGPRRAPAVQVNFVVRDGAFLVSAGSTALSLDLVHVSYPPVATPPANFSTVENIPVVLELRGTDLDGNVLGAQVTASPQGEMFQFNASASGCPVAAATALGAQLTAEMALTCRGDALLDSSPLVLDPLLRVIYTPSLYFSGRSSMSYAVFQSELAGTPFSPVVSVDVFVSNVLYAPFFPLALPGASVGQHDLTRLNVSQASVRLLQLSSYAPIIDPEGAPALTFFLTTLPAQGALYQMPAAFDPNDADFMPDNRADGSIPPTVLQRLGVLSNPIRAGSAALPLNITNPASYLAFAPASAEDTGPVSLNFFYARFNYSVTNGLLAAVGDRQIDLHVRPVYMPPRVPARLPAANFTVRTRENEAVVIELAGWVDDAFTLGTYSVFVVERPLKGVLCQFDPLSAGELAVLSEADAELTDSGIVRGSGGTVDPTVSAATPCGAAYGGPVFAEVKDSSRQSLLLPPRVVFMPLLNSFGKAADLFSYRIQDSTKTFSSKCVVIADVSFVNQPPTVPLPSSAALRFKITPDRFPNAIVPPAAGAAPFLVIDLPASDPDNTIDQLRFNLLSLPTRGLWRQRSLINGTETIAPLFPGAGESGDGEAEALAAQHLLPIPLIGSSLLYHPGSSGGSANPYATVAYSVSDPSGLNVSSSITLILDCGLSLYPNVWTMGAQKGALCLPCPSGASCASSGAFKPVSMFGYWRSNVLDLSGGPIYVPCKVASSCLTSQWADAGLDLDGLQLTQHETALFANASRAFSGVDTSTLGCAPGFQGRLCSACMPGWFKQGQLCVACPAGANGDNTLHLLFQFLQIAVPLMTAGLAVLYVLKVKLKIDLTFVGVTLKFMQTVTSFKSFRLSWPTSNSSLFDKLSFVSIDVELLSLECTIPSIQFTTKWMSFMLLPVIAAGVVLAGALLASVAVVAFKWAREWWQAHQLIKAQRLLGKDKHNRNNSDQLPPLTSLAIQGDSAQPQPQQSGANGDAEPELEPGAAPQPADTPAAAAAGAAPSTAAKALKGVKAKAAVKAKTAATKAAPKSVQTQKSTRAIPVPQGAKKAKAAKAVAVKAAPTRVLTAATPVKEGAADTALSPADSSPAPVPDAAADAADAAANSDADAAAVTDGASDSSPIASAPSFLSLLPLLRTRASKFIGQGFSVFILFVDFIYLPLCIMCMNMLACTRLADGTLSLDYAPALRCDEPWWAEWSQIGVLCLMLYGLGIPTLYVFIFFHLRPPVHTYPPACVPKSCGRWILCPRELNHRAWKEDVLANPRGRTPPDAARELHHYISLLAWHKTFKQLVDPFHRHKFFWQLLVISRSLCISACAVFLQNEALYQSAIILVALGLALVLQLVYRPYKFHVNYNLNQLEIVNLISLSVILTCGIIFLLSAPDQGVLHSGDLKYPGFRGLLNVAIYMLMALVLALAARIFIAQVKFRLQYKSSWRHSKYKKKWHRFKVAVRTTNWKAVVCCRAPWPQLFGPPKPPGHKAAAKYASQQDETVTATDAAAAAATTLVLADGADPAVGGGFDALGSAGAITSRPAPSKSDDSPFLPHSSHSITPVHGPLAANGADASGTKAAGKKHVTLHLPVTPDAIAGTSAAPVHAAEPSEFAASTHVGGAESTATVGGGGPASTRLGGQGEGSVVSLQPEDFSTAMTPSAGPRPLTSPDARSSCSSAGAPKTHSFLSPKNATTAAAVPAPPVVADGAAAAAAAAAVASPPSTDPTAYRLLSPTPPPGGAAAGESGAVLGADVGPGSSSKAATPALSPAASPQPPPQDSLLRADSGYDDEDSEEGASAADGGGRGEGAPSGHNRLRSAVWQPPRLSVASPLKGLDARSLYTHARYVSLDQFSLRQIQEINAGAAGGEEWDREPADRPDEIAVPDDEEEELWLTRPTPSPPSNHEANGEGRATSTTPTAAAAAAMAQASGRGSGQPGPGGRLTPQLRDPSPSPDSHAHGSDTPLSPLLERDDPLKHVRVMIGRPSYSRWFKPPPPAGLFAKRAHLVGQAGMLARLMRQSSAEIEGWDPHAEYDEEGEDYNDEDEQAGAEPAARNEKVAAQSRLSMVMQTLGLAPKQKPKAKAAAAPAAAQRGKPRVVANIPLAGSKKAGGAPLPGVPSHVKDKPRGAGAAGASSSSSPFNGRSGASPPTAMPLRRPPAAGSSTAVAAKAGFANLASALVADAKTKPRPKTSAGAGAGAGAGAAAGVGLSRDSSRIDLASPSRPLAIGSQPRATLPKAVPIKPAAAGGAAVGADSSRTPVASRPSISRASAPATPKGTAAKAGLPSQARVNLSAFSTLSGGAAAAAAAAGTGPSFTGGARRGSVLSTFVSLHGKAGPSPNPAKGRGSAAASPSPRSSPIVSRAQTPELVPAANTSRAGSRAPSPTPHATARLGSVRSSPAASPSPAPLPRSSPSGLTARSPTTPAGAGALSSRPPTFVRTPTVGNKSTAPGSGGGGGGKTVLVSPLALNLPVAAGGGVVQLHRKSVMRLASLSPSPRQPPAAVGASTGGADGSASSSSLDTPKRGGMGIRELGSGSKPLGGSNSRVGTGATVSGGAPKRSGTATARKLSAAASGGGGQARASVSATVATPSASAAPKSRGQAQRHESVDFDESGGAAILRTYDSPSGNEDGDGAGEPTELSLGRSLMGGIGSGSVGVGSGELVGLSSRPLLAQSFSSSSHVASVRAPSPSPPMRPKIALSKHVPGALVAALQMAAPQQQQPAVRKPPPSPITVATTTHVGPHTPHTAPASGPRSAASAFHATTSLSRGP